MVSPNLFLFNFLNSSKIIGSCFYRTVVIDKMNVVNFNLPFFVDRALSHCYLQNEQAISMFSVGVSHAKTNSPIASEITRN